MRHKEPPPVAILSARLMRAYPTLSPYSSASLAVELCAIERAQHRHAERQCSGEDGGYVRRVNVQWLGGAKVEHDPEAEARAGERIGHRIREWLAHLVDRSQCPVTDCRIDLHGDPRGATLLLRLPGEAEAVAV